jgi:tetratricopeptide (TPR) repeat protein
MLVAAFENLTGEEGLDRTVEQAFEREVGHSQVFRTVQRDRIDDALRLMRKPAGTRLDAATAREVSLRDGRIRAVLTGRIVKIGRRYELTSEILDPVEGAIRASFGEDVGRPEDLLAAIHRQAGKMRLANRTSATATNRPLPRVTTASLQALRWYSQALELFGADFSNSAALERYLRDALRADPDFPSALNLLAWIIHNQGRSPDEYLPYAERAVKVGQPVTEVERHFIAGSLHHLRANAASDETVQRAEFREAILAYEAVLRIQPDHPFAANNLRAPYEVWKRPDDLAAVYGRLADARPSDLTSNITAGNEYMRVGNRTQAMRYFERARALMSPADAEAHPEWDFLLRMLPVQDAWLDGDARQARERLDAVARTIDRGDVRRRSQLAGRVVDVYLTLGSLDAADDVADRIPHPVIRDQSRARILWQRNDTAAMRRLLVPRAADRETAPAFSGLFVLAGMVPEARRSIRGILSTSFQRQQVDYLEARVALDASDFDRARTLARRALEAAPGSPGVAALLYADTIASAENAGGHAALAIESLERVTAQPAATFHNGAGGLWTAARAHLAMLYRAVGREKEAETVERELLGLLSIADPDYPLLVELQQRSRQQPSTDRLHSPF